MAKKEHPSVDQLRRLSTLKDFEDDELIALSEKIEILHAKKGAVLIPLGSDHKDTFYLVDGKIILKAADGGSKVISHNDQTAKDPIARLRPSRFDVIAASKVAYLEISEQVLASMREELSGVEVDTYEVGEDGVEDLDTENQITFRLYEDLNKNTLLLPSLPETAVRVGQALATESADADKIARIIETDMAMTTKLIKAANSAFYGGSRQVQGLKDAIVRIGMKTTHKLVMSFALRELFRSPSKILTDHMKNLWDHSRQIAAISHVLAKKVGGFDPDHAMLAGIVHDVGTLIILNYARDFLESAESERQLDEAISKMRGQVGQMALSRWNFPQDLITSASEAENWHRAHDGPADYADIVITAQLIAFLNDEDIAGLPQLSDCLPAQRLGLSDESTDNEDGLLAQAAEEISQAEAMLEVD